MFFLGIGGETGRVTKVSGLWFILLCLHQNVCSFMENISFEVVVVFLLCNFRRVIIPALIF